ncbi:RWD domain-containing protein [Lasiosphaeria hispida]|uniref:RBR-type E3 ubiquitin transferase n=1 Tax=Lasiosphaeria hispida TaxID=260671 RepID=A0AAJ0HR94_9PEZI|nr:RWD domain-containing protein [Lasiosphaeria hispida]
MASLDPDELESPRDIELTSLAAIYPEIQQIRPNDPYIIALDVPVTPSDPVVVFFPAVAEAETPTDPRAHQQGNQYGGPQGNNASVVDSHELAHLPSLHLEIVFGPRYPAEQPPQITVSTTPPWLPAQTVRKLQDDGPRLWEEMGRDMVGFTYIDYIQQSAEHVFGLVGDKGALKVDSQHKIAILDYDIKARRAAFEKGTFDCGKGSVCHRMLDCGHVFCTDCLKDFYNNAIKEGDLASVRCLAPNCAKERGKARETSPSGKKRKKPRTYINPSELLQIPLEQDVVKRYVSLKYKTELESDKNTIYCPRQWCSGAARSKKHKKPQGLELAEDSDDSASDNEGEGAGGERSADGAKSKPKPYEAGAELLAICEECSFAFCSRCFQTWHGEFYRCAPRRDKGEITAEEQASIEYMKMHTTPCPTCAAPAQKTHGCNHMICYRCQSHFCYLCSAWLDPGNPYQHFNEMPRGRVTACYMRLWELENGDGDDVGHGFAGGVEGRPPPAAVGAEPAPPPAQEFVPEIEEPDDEEDAVAEAARVAGAAAAALGHVNENGGQVGIAREGPLVLRIAANQPAGAGRGGPRGRAAAQPARGGGPQHQNAARGRRQHQPAGVGARGAAAPGGGGGARVAARPQGAGGFNGQRGRGGHGGPPHRQNNQANQAHHQQQQNQQVQRRNNNNNNVAAPAAAAPAAAPPVAAAAANAPQDVEIEGGGLDPAQQAWIRQFVQLALDDQEDILFGEGSDDEWE